MKSKTILNINLAIVGLGLISACTPTELSYTAIRDEPTDLAYAIEVCDAEGDAVGYSVSKGVAAATPDIEGGGFAGGFANGMQGYGEGRQAAKRVFRACMAREGYRVSEN